MQNSQVASGAHVQDGVQTSTVHMVPLVVQRTSQQPKNVAAFLVPGVQPLLPVHVPHWPHESHVCVPRLQLPQRCVVPGVQTGAEGQEQAPHWHEESQVSLPYVLQDCVLFGAQTPWPVQVPGGPHWPHPSQVSVALPQSPHATVWVVPGVQTGVPVQLAQPQRPAQPVPQNLFLSLQLEQREPRTHWHEELHVCA